MTPLHFVEAVVGIWVDYWPLFVVIACVSITAGFIVSQLAQCERERHCYIYGHEWKGDVFNNFWCGRCGKLLE